MLKVTRGPVIRFFNLRNYIAIFLKIICTQILVFLGDGQHLQRSNVERPIFRNFEISNIEITKVELFDSSITGCIFTFFKILKTLKIHI